MKGLWIRAVFALELVALLCACGARAEESRIFALASEQHETAGAQTPSVELIDYLMVLMFASSDMFDPVDSGAMSSPGDNTEQP